MVEHLASLSAMTHYTEVLTCLSVGYPWGLSALLAGSTMVLTFINLQPMTSGFLLPAQYAASLVFRVYVSIHVQPDLFEGVCKARALLIGQLYRPII